MSRMFEKSYADPIVAKIPGKGAIFAEFDGVPTASAVGYAPGCLAIDRTNGNVYKNTGTSSSATWTEMEAAGGTFATLTITDLTTTNAAITNAAITNGSLAASGTMTLANLTNFALGTGSGTRIGTAANQKLGMWGVTPVIQPATTTEVTGEAGLGNNVLGSVYVTNTSNFNGNSGTKTYTINAIVRALKEAGILAAS